MFQQLVAMKLAKCLDKDAAMFVVYYKRKQMALDYFIDKMITVTAKEKRKAAKPKPTKKIKIGRRRRARKDYPGQTKMFGLD
jgi:hypothetical protein